MSARDYLRLLADSPTIIRTLQETYGSHEPDEQWPQRAAVHPAVNSVHPHLVQTRVARIVQETPDTRTLCLEAVDGDLPPHTAGQYVNVFVEISGVRTSRPMSISSAPGDVSMELTIKRKPGGFVSNHLVDNVQQDDRLTISGPEGDLSYMSFRDGKELVFIAGGSGITPFMGMMEQILERHPDVQIHLLYGSVDPEQIIFRDRIEALAGRHERLGLTLTVDRPDDQWRGQQGVIDHQMITAAVGARGVQDRTFFVCGPQAMERAVKEALERMGVPRGRVRGELAGPVDDPTTLPGWPEGLEPGDEVILGVSGSERTVTAKAGEPLLNSLERAGFALPALCRSGTCGSCRTRVMEGTVVQRETSQRPSTEQADYVNACACYPVSDAVFQIPGESFQRADYQTTTLPEAAAHEPAPPPMGRQAQGPLGAWISGALALSGICLLVLLVVAGFHWWP